jgi:hypothetical protein
MLGGLLVLSTLIEFFKLQVIKGTKITIISDNLSMIHQVKWHMGSKLMVSEHYATYIDVELQILVDIKALQQSKVLLNFEHIKGHKDKKALSRTSPRRLNEMRWLINSPQRSLTSVRILDLL